MTSIHARTAVVLAIIALGLAFLYGTYSHGVKITDSKWKAVLADQALLQAICAAAARQPIELKSSAARLRPTR